MPFFQDPLAIFAVLMLNIILCEQLTKLPYFRAFGSALLVIITTAITANLGIIPSASTPAPLYDGIFTYLAPLSIFYLLLTVNLRGLKKSRRAHDFVFSVGFGWNHAGRVGGHVFDQGARKFG